MGNINGKNPRHSYKRDMLRRRVAAIGAPCHICELAIDYSLRAGNPLSFELDELVPVSKGGDPSDPRNVAAAHRCCNQWRSNRSVNAVAIIKVGVRAEYGGWRTPLDFVAMAKAIARGGKARPCVLPSDLPHSREW